MIASGNPYRSPSIPPKPQVSATTRVARLRLFRFWQRRRLALFACLIALVVLKLVEGLAPHWRAEWMCLQQGVIVFLFANLFRFCWISTLKSTTRPHVWTCRVETASVFVFLGFKAGLSYPCLCMSISGEPSLKDYLDRCVVFGTPFLIAALFVCIRKYPLAAVVSGLLIAFVKLIHPVYLDWVH